jgi:hypothetical protein
MAWAVPAARRWWWVVWCGQWLAFGALLMHPLNSTALRLALLILAGAGWATALLLVWHWRPGRGAARWIVGLLPSLPLLLLVMPARQRDVEDLRLRYAGALRSYVGTTYVWGGEGRLGIDCSGLVRRALIDACLASAWARLDAGCLRHAASLWWHDQSAAAMGRCEAGTTVHLFRSGRVAGLSEVQALKAGDLAVLGGGSHVMAYLGRSAWIEADPGEGKVLVLVSGQPSPWLAVPAQLVRWRILSD